MNKDIFTEQMNRVEREIDRVKELDKVNSILQSYNWVFLHPYSQGMDIGYMRKLVETENPEKEIFAFFAHKFLHLKATIHLVDGFHRNRPFLKDYAHYIEESILLCLQRDFKGAISILIPVFEGTLRKYLVSKEGDTKKKVTRFKELIPAIEHFKKDYLRLQEQYLKQEYQYLIVSGRYLDVNQEKAILKKHSEYFDIWMKQLKNYLANNLYQNTTESDPSDKFNRHLIFHALEDNVEFSFANYLRLFNSINYLSWVIGLTHEGCSVLSIANETDVRNKWVDYLKVLALSESLAESKAKILNQKVESFREFLPDDYTPFLKPSQQGIKTIIDNYEYLKANKYPPINNLPKLVSAISFIRNIKKTSKKMNSGGNL